MRSKIFTALLAAVALTMTASQATAASWHKITAKSDRFSVQFSGDLSIEPIPLSESARSGIVTSTMYMQDGGSYVFLVGATLIKGTPHFQDGVNSTMGAYHCARIESDETTTLSDGAQMREIHARSCNNNSRIAGRFYARGQWFYQVLYAIPEGADFSDGEHYLRSFSLL